MKHNERVVKVRQEMEEVNKMCSGEDIVVGPVPCGAFNCMGNVLHSHLPQKLG